MKMCGIVASGDPADAATFCEVGLDECPVTPVQFAKGMQRLDHAGALGPAASRAGRQRDDGELARRQRFEAAVIKVTGSFPGGIENIPGFDILDGGGNRQAVLREPDSPALEIRPDLFVLNIVKPPVLKKVRTAFHLFQPGARGCGSSPSKSA